MYNIINERLFFHQTTKEGKTMSVKEKLMQLTGVNKQSPYVKNHFYLTNMKSSIYMSVIVIVLEIWMIERMIRTIFEKDLGSKLESLIESYFSNYFMLLSAGTLMLLFALRALFNFRKTRWLAIAVILLSLSVVVFEIRMITQFGGSSKTTADLINYLILFSASVVMICFSVVLMLDRKEKKWHSLCVMYVFSFCCINFGIIMSVHSFAKGDQILTFLTMELFVICLLIWRPWIGFLVLTVSYGVFYYRISGIIDISTVERIDGIIDLNTAQIGLGDGVKINGFTMWLSTLLFCIANYSRTMSQGLKDENLEQVNTYLSKISIFDELTGIHNMVHFRTEAEKMLSYVTTDKENSVFLFMDIENFKSYNEKYGFTEGNELLKKTAKIIDETFTGSLVSRFSDDHFVVYTKLDGCKEKISEISVKIHNMQREVHLELKCGAYKPAENDTDASLACDRARFACNTIKKHYHNHFRFYDKKLEEKFRLKQYIVNNIDTAISNDYIKVFYQPIVSTKDGSICGLEALARWNDPKYGLLPPGMFIDTLEEYRQIHKLDQTIIEIVCRDYRQAADEGKPFVPASINFSRLDFELFNVVEFLGSMTEKYRVPKNFIDVEITESALTDQQDFLQKSVDNLRSAGYKVWLDDFGSGYSSLNVLKDYQFDVLKIDMKFLSGFGSNDKAAPILKNIVELTRQLDLVSLTEGVETEQQFEFLRSIGCNRAQGYLFSKPCPKEELYEKVTEGKLKISEEYENK